MIHKTWIKKLNKFQTIPRKERLLCYLGKSSITTFTILQILPQWEELNFSVYDIKYKSILGIMTASPKKITHNFQKDSMWNEPHNL